MSGDAARTNRRYRVWVYSCFPATYLAHLVEESWAAGGFPAWLTAATGLTLPLESFVVYNVVGLTAMLAGTLLALSRWRMEWILTTAATAFLLNAISHAAVSVLTVSYSPGLVTGIALWGPLCVWTLHRARQASAPRPFRAAVIAGVGMHLLVLAMLVVNG